MIINNFRIYEKGMWAIESAHITWNNQYMDVYIAVPIQFKNAICQTNADAFIVGFIPLAAKYNEDIIVEERCISKELVVNIETILIPAFNKMGCGSKQICIKGIYNNDSFGKRYGATGISLGLDSFYTISKNSPKNIRYLLNVIDCNDFDNLLSDISLYDRKNERKKTVTQKCKREYIPVLTNINYILNGDFVFSQIHSFVHLSMSMALMNLINVYYYSTGYSNEEFCLNFNDSSHYDVLIGKVVTYSCFSMKTSGGEVSRFEKTNFLSNNSMVEEYLDVCLNNRMEIENSFTNCSLCDKCRRTMVTLDVLTKLNNFNKVFDVNFYYKNKSWYIGEILYADIIMKDLFAKEIIQEMSRRNYHIPLVAWFFFLKRGLQNQVNKMKGFLKQK